MKRIEIQTTNDLDRIVAESTEKEVLIFKHSTRCGISRMALKTFEIEGKEKGVEHFYYLDLLSFRDLSNKIAEQFDVMHQSPQLLVIKDGAVVKHSSHHKIAI